MFALKKLLNNPLASIFLLSLHVFRAIAGIQYYAVIHAISENTTNLFYLILLFVLLPIILYGFFTYMIQYLITTFFQPKEFTFKKMGSYMWAISKLLVFAWIIAWIWMWLSNGVRDEFAVWYGTLTIIPIGILFTVAITHLSARFFLLDDPVTNHAIPYLFATQSFVNLFVPTIVFILFLLLSFLPLYWSSPLISQLIAWLGIILASITFDINTYNQYTKSINILKSVKNARKR